LAGSSGLWAVFSLCNGELEDEGRQGHTHSTCHGTDAPTPLVPQRTAAAPAVRRHCDASEPARWCAGATPVACRPAPSQCRLKVFSQATTMLPLRRHGVGSRLSLNMEPGADGHPGGSWPCRPAVASTGEPPQRSLVVLQTGPRRQARGPLALAPRTSRRTTAPLRASHRSFCCARASGFHRQTTAAAGGLSHSKPKNLSHAT